MRHLKVAGIVTILVLAAGCVTEGVRPTEPVSDEDAARANLALGVGYVQEGRPDFAIDVLRRALDIDPRLAEAHGAIAVAYDQTGEAELAEEHHRRATQLASSNAGLQNSYAVFLCRRNRWNDAEPYFERAIARAGNTPPITPRINAGTCALAAGDLEAAEAQFRAVLALQESPAALRGLMDVSLRSSNYINGRAFWQRLERTGNVEAADLVSCYAIEAQLGDSEAARLCADRLRREFPTSPELSRLRTLERDAG